MQDAGPPGIIPPMSTALLRTPLYDTHVREGGKIVEHRGVGDIVSVLQQIGAMPSFG